MLPALSIDGLVQGCVFFLTVFFVGIVLYSSRSPLVLKLLFFFRWLFEGVLDLLWVIIDRLAYCLRLVLFVA